MKKLLTLTAVAVLGISLGISSLAGASENIVVNTNSLRASTAKSVEVKGAGTVSDFTEFYITPKGLAGNSVSASSDSDSYTVFGVRINEDRAS